MMRAAIGHRWLDLQERALGGVDRLAARLGRTVVDAEAVHLATGVRGEEAALFFLRRQGYTVVARRWRSALLMGDLDLVAWEGDRLCFIEVKTRTGRTLLPAETAVDEEKREMLRRLAGAYLRPFAEKQRRAVQVRFDVVAVYFGRDGDGAGTEIELIRGAFPRRAGR